MEVRSQQETASLVKTLHDNISSVLIGKPEVVQLAIVTLLAEGHVLIEDAPGVGKTSLAKAIAKSLHCDYKRVQFTPDMLPSDILGSNVFLPSLGEFEFRKGPIFTNVLLADEINRAPAKVQSALLEAMGERQISVGMRTFPLPKLFMVMATQNPIEQEGTYPLPEAQLDRFLMHVVIDYPSADAEREILHLARSDYRQGIPNVDIRLTQEQVMAARQAVSDIYMAEPVEQYLLALILATRDAATLDPELARWTAFGASPRGTIALDRCARALAWLDGRDYVTPDDVQTMAYDVLRHRILLTFEAEAEGMTADSVLQRLIDRVPVAA